MRSRLTIAVVVSLAVAHLGLAACSAPVPPAPSPSWTAPPWVAEQAAQREEYRAGLQACLDGKGWRVTVDLNGGIVEPFTSDEVSRFRTDEESCRVAMGLSAEGTPATTEELRTGYRQMLDTRACLVAHGLDMAPPPSEDAWLDAVQAGTNAWHPYDDPSLNALSMAQQDELWALCPQPWLFPR